MASERKSDKNFDVNELKEKLEKAHQPTAWNEAKEWFETNLGDDTYSRIQLLSAILTSKTPFQYDDKLEEAGVEPFHCLQGDIISSTVTNVPEPISAFNAGDPYYYILVPASCSANRYKFVLTARLIPVTAADKNQQITLKSALLFKTHKYFYLPPLDGQADDVIGNLAHFEEISYITQDVLKHTQRVCSLSEVGWRLFNAFLTFHFTRPSDEEKIIRNNSSDSVVIIEETDEATT